MNDNGLTLFNNARAAIAKVVRIDEIKDIRDRAEALRKYSQQAGESLDMQNDCAEIKLRAERRAGELLGGMEKQTPGEHWKKKRSHDATVSPTLTDLNITKSQSSRWQKIATIPNQKFEDFITKTRSIENKELTTVAALKLSTQIEAQAPIENTVPIEVEPGMYRTIYADPPWKYGNQATRAAANNHYATLSVDEICEFEIDGVHVSEIAAENSHLHLWTTNAFLFDAKRVIETWGFEYKSCFVWVKPQLGIGNYWRVSHEFMLFGIRGTLKYTDRSQTSWLEAPRSKHSAKPGRVREIIELVSPAPRLEIFGRQEQAGWDVYGDQVQPSLFMDDSSRGKC